jgi:hypothetical protein
MLYPVNDDNIMPLANVVFREDLYPRIETSAETVQKYAETLELLPPIEINQHRELIDGWHRWTAHRKAGAEHIRFTVTQTASDMELLELAIERNAQHGLQLSQTDKRKMAQQIYRATPPDQQGKKKRSLARLLSVEERTVHNWLSRIDKDNKEERDCAVFSLWLACKTQDEIADAVGMARTGVERILTQTETFQFASKTGILSEIDDEEERWRQIEADNRKAAIHQKDFTVPLYSAQKQQEKSDGVEHFGNTDPVFLDRLLYLYTKPFEIVVDPFAGGGSTIDVCRKRFRRYWVSDRLPIVEREKEIRKHDLTDGLPKLHNWRDVALIYLDPPYWKQAEGRYSNDPTDLANMPLDDFHAWLVKIINGFAAKLSPGAAIALVMQSTQWNAPEHEYTDHLLAIAHDVKAKIDMRIQAPYESQQCTAQMVTWAKENRKLLVISREIVVWKIIHG